MDDARTGIAITDELKYYSTRIRNNYIRKGS